jgi:hypothetical protein
MAAATNAYGDLMQYPANPYINSVNQQYRSIDMTNPSQVNFPAMTGAEGWFSAPKASVPGGAQTGYQWAQGQYSPELLGNINQMYGLLQGQIGQQPDLTAAWKQYQPQSLAGMYQGMMGQNQLGEQMEYNRALSRLKGQAGTARQGLNTAMAARRGGAGAGAFQGGLDQINRSLMQGTGELATNQYMSNLARQEAQNQALMGYAGQDVTNQMGWQTGLINAMNQGWQNQQQPLSNMAGWLSQMIPFEQYNISTPMQAGLQAQGMNLQGSIAEENANAARREEAMG